MNKAALIFFAGVILSVAACSGESVKRTSFETLQNIREQQCAKDLSGHCPPRESYDDYQRKKKAADASAGKAEGTAPAPSQQ